MGTDELSGLRVPEVTVWTVWLDRDPAEARRCGVMTRLGLEMGIGPAFEPALALHRARGFADGPAVSVDRTSDFHSFLHLAP